MKMAKKKNNLPEARVKLVLTEGLFSETKIDSADTAVQLIREEMETYDREVFITLNLDTKGRPLNMHIVGIGELTQAAVYIPNIFKTAILSNANSVICFHNHPSGIAYPSKQDEALTLRVLNAGKVIGIKVLDHIIVGRNEWYSFQQEGIIEGMENHLAEIMREHPYTLATEERAAYGKPKAR